MTPEHIADFIINNDLEIQAIHRDYVTIGRAVREEFPDETVTDTNIEQAVEIALQDNYVQMVAKRLNHDEFHETLALVRPTFVQCALYGCDKADLPDEMIWDEERDNAYCSLEHMAEDWRTA